MNEIKTQMTSGMKAATDVRPYAKQYTIIREKIFSFGINNTASFIPELSKDMFNSPFGLSPRDVERNVGFFDELIVSIGQMVGFLEAIQENKVKVLTELEEFLYKNLRKNIINRPEKEKDIQDVIAIMLNSKGISYQREIVRISYSAKTFIPDFTFEDLNATLEVKFCKTDQKEKALVDEINADILAYSTKYQNLTFLIYDMGMIRDTEQFANDIEKNSPRIKVLVIKQ